MTVMDSSQGTKLVSPWIVFVIKTGEKKGRKKKQEMKFIAMCYILCALSEFLEHNVFKLTESRERERERKERMREKEPEREIRMKISSKKKSNELGKNSGSN